MSRLNGEELADAFGDSVNNMNFDEIGFVNKFKNQHRTLQQSMIKSMLKCIEAAAEPEYRRDGRNELAHETCKTLISGWRKELVVTLLSDSNAYWTKENAEGYANNPDVKPSNLPCI